MVRFISTKIGLFQPHGQKKSQALSLGKAISSGKDNREESCKHTFTLRIENNPWATDTHLQQCTNRANI